MDMQEIISLLRDGGPALFKAADDARRAYVGDEVHLRALIEFSNYCKQNCLYCGLRCANPKIQRYRMSAAEILETAASAKEWGYKTLVLQSGEDSYFTSDKLLPIIDGIKKLGLALTLSIGERSFEDYQAFKQAGADRYLLRIETTDKELYEKLDPGMSFENRLRCLRDLQKLGYEVGSGILVGLPGQSIESIAKDILFLKNFPVDMAGIGPFIAHEDTPLGKDGGDYFELSLRVMAVLRRLMPDINIPATTAMETLRENGRFAALESGANVIMPNITPAQYSQNYKTYPGKFRAPLPPREYKAQLERRLTDIGRKAGAGFGASKRFT